MLKNKDVIILTLAFLLQDVATFYLIRFDLAAGLESIFIEAAKTCLCFSICVQKLIQYWDSQRKKIFNTLKDELVFIADIL